MAGQNVFRVMLRMQIHPGMEREFEETWYAIGDGITGHPANLGQWLAKSAEEDGVYYVTSDWVDEPRFREFERSERHLEHRTRLHPYRSGGSMTTMRVVYAMRGART
ncbi:antibiotic biosynthesis monooxygenase family protein [Actinoallomurus iriomotensis]|uniref:Antibiotic biosynthesis monooxygenase n=1 Tax=Actinoallomurus iriomotensis TaxID=478107 RepID=A0A9W6S0Z9_9ACTN|nr:antibiotic biosynthesis monooxygenase family protein [Actinoallomurus iriomotensis]GLY75513.1 antibiotic biosynthesis monooxygenase [Actinoallomurus iriomotensis]GLY85124.1 antibiotic biosynthesis monooxygenase [Actinoallomurus iriomotensis]